MRMDVTTGPSCARLAIICVLLDCKLNIAKSIAQC